MCFLLVRFVGMLNVKWLCRHSKQHFHSAVHYIVLYIYRMCTKPNLDIKVYEDSLSGYTVLDIDKWYSVVGIRRLSSSVRDAMVSESQIKRAFNLSKVL